MGLNWLRILGLLALPLAILLSDRSWAADADYGIRRVRRDGVEVKYAAQSIADMVNAGLVSQFSPDPADIAREPDQVLDLAAKDEFTTALDTIYDRALIRLEQSALIQQLLKKTDWDRSDRVEWERNLAQIVSEERNSIPGLDKFRNVNDNSPAAPDSDRKGRKGEAPVLIVRPAQINALSSDIRNKTHRLEFDCEQMTAVDGILMQRLEDRLLAGGSGLKTPSAYMRVTGFIFIEHDFFMGLPDPFLANHHVFLVSSASGNIIEATANGLKKEELVYREPLPGWQGLDAYLNGQPAMVHGEKKFVFYTSLPDVQVAREAVRVLKRPIYVERIPELLARAQADESKLTEGMSRYNSNPDVRRMMGILNSADKTLSEEQKSEISKILRDSEVRLLQRPTEDWISRALFRLTDLKYVASALSADDPKRKELLAQVGTFFAAIEKSLKSAAFDVLVVDLDPRDTNYVLAQKLSGGFFRPRRDSYEGPVPFLKPITAHEVFQLKLKGEGPPGS